MHSHHKTAILVGGILGIVIGYTQADPSTSLALSNYPVYSSIYNYIIQM